MSTTIERPVAPTKERPKKSKTVIEDTTKDASSVSPGPRVSRGDVPLNALAALVQDLEDVRKATDNRIRILTTDEPDKHGIVRGFALDEDDPTVAALKISAANVEQVEEEAIKALQKAMKRHPLGPWVAQQRGLGEKQIARLLSAVGDPYWHPLYNRPRTVSELWAFSGLHTLTVEDGGPNVAARRVKGHKSNWSTEAKTRSWLAATSCVKQPSGTPYRDIYDEGREKYEFALHTRPCIRCGPSGKPAEANTPLSPGHQHARAIRLVQKAILRDLWREAKRLHEEGKIGT